MRLSYYVSCSGVTRGAHCNTVVSAALDVSDLGIQESEDHLRRLKIPLLLVFTQLLISFWVVLLRLASKLAIGVITHGVDKPAAGQKKSVFHTTRYLRNVSALHASFELETFHRLDAKLFKVLSMEL